jgi:hypothetical protein
MEAACFFETLVSIYHTSLTQEITVFMFTVFRLSHLTQCSWCDGTAAETVTFAILETTLNVKDGIMRNVSGPNQGHAENSVNEKLKK